MGYYSTHADGGGGGGGGGQTDTVTGVNGVTNTGTNVNAVLQPVYGTTALTICEGDDARLSNARTPTAHAASHSDGGSDEIDVANLGSTSAPGASYVPSSDGAGGLGWVDSSTFGTGDVVGPSSAVDNSVPTFDGTSGKLIQSTPFLISGIPVSPGTNTLGAAALLGVNTVQTAGTAQATGSGLFSIVVGTAESTTAGATAEMNSTFASGKAGTIILGYAKASLSGATATIDGRGSGAVVVGTAQSNFAQTALIDAQGDGSLIAGAAITASGSDSTMSTATSAPGGFVQGYVNGGSMTSAAQGCGVRGQAVSGGILSAGTGAGGGFISGYAAGGTMTSNGFGTVAIGAALAGGTITGGGFGSFVGGFCSGAGANITAGGIASGSITWGNCATGSTISTGLSASGAVALGAASGGNNISASGVASLAFGSASSGNITASATGAIQYGQGTNAITNSLQVGQAGSNGIHIIGSGLPGTPVNGMIWSDGTDVFVRTGGVTKNMSAI